MEGKRLERAWDDAKSIGYWTYMGVRLVLDMVRYPFSVEATREREKARDYRREERIRYRDNCKIWRAVKDTRKEIEKKRKGAGLFE